jgi:hypothetical protein
MTAASMMRPPARENRRNLPAGTAVLPDEEVHRDEHGLEEDVEEEHVRRGEHPDDERLEHEHEREVVLLARVGDAVRAGQVAPGGQEADRHEDERHEDERQRDPVDAEGVAHPELRDPLVLLGEPELPLLRGPPVGDGGEDAGDEGQQREAEGDLLGARRGAGREEPDHDGAHQRDGADDGEPGDAVHHCITHTAPRMTTTPTSIVRA